MSYNGHYDDTSGSFKYDEPLELTSWVEYVPYFYIDPWSHMVNDFTESTSYTLSRNALEYDDVLHTYMWRTHCFSYLRFQQTYMTWHPQRGAVVNFNTGEPIGAVTYGYYHDWLEREAWVPNKWQEKTQFITSSCRDPKSWFSYRLTLDGSNWYQKDTTSGPILNEDGETYSYRPMTETWTAASQYMQYWTAYEGLYEGSKCSEGSTFECFNEGVPQYNSYIFTNLVYRDYPNTLFVDDVANATFYTKNKVIDGDPQPPAIFMRTERSAYHFSPDGSMYFNRPIGEGATPGNPLSSVNNHFVAYQSNSFEDLYLGSDALYAQYRQWQSGEASSFYDNLTTDMVPTVYNPYIDVESC